MNPFSELDEREAADRLNRACVAGDLPAAYAVILRLKADPQSRVMLRAGFATMGPMQKQAAEHHQGQIARACRHKVDGRGLQAIPEPSL